MTARAFAAAEGLGGGELARWALAAAVALAAHIALAAVYLLAPAPRPEGAAMAPAIIVDLAPVAVAPPSVVDLAPGPEMTESQAAPEPVPPPPEPVEHTEIEPLPKVETKTVHAEPLPAPEPVPQPMEQLQVPEPPPKIETEAAVTLPLPVPAPPRDEALKDIEKPRVAEKPKEVDKPKEEPRETTKPEQAAPAPRTTAPQRSESKPAPVARAPSPGSAASRSAIATWRDRVIARLQSAKRYPAGTHNIQGTASVAFTVDRSGHVVGRRLVRSSGHSALDREALAMIDRAQPFPAFPSAMTQPRIALTVPVRFSVR
jgi:periplasmic protein TonB